MCFYVSDLVPKGHKIEETPEVPLVLSDSVEELKRTKEAVAVLKKLKAWSDIEKVKM